MLKLSKLPNLKIYTPQKKTQSWTVKFPKNEIRIHKNWKTVSDMNYKSIKLEKSKNFKSLKSDNASWKISVYFTFQIWNRSMFGIFIIADFQSIHSKSNQFNTFFPWTSLICVSSPKCVYMCVKRCPSKTPNAFFCVSPNAFICVVTKCVYMCVTKCVYMCVTKCICWRNGARFARLPLLASLARFLTV